MQRQREEDRAVLFGIYDAETDELVGQLVLFGILRGGFQEARIGYMLSGAHSGRGYASEAVRLAVDYAFTTLGLHRLETGVQLDNPASARVLEKAGFRREAISERWILIGAEWRDCTRFALTSEEWSQHV